MPHFFFHFRDEVGLECDELGCEFPDVETAYLEAFAAATSLWTEMLEQRRDPRLARFEVSDADGHSIFELPLSEVLASTTARSLKREWSRADAAQDRAQHVVVMTKRLGEQIDETRRRVQETRDLLKQIADQH